MANKLLVDYLDRANANYLLLEHPFAFSAPQVAQFAHIQGANLAKVAMVKLDGLLSMVVLPAHYCVDLYSLAKELSVDHARLAIETEFSYRFPRCEVGAIPPFGHLFGVEAYMKPVFNTEDSIAFNAGSHTETVIMPYWEFERLAFVNHLSQGVTAPEGRSNFAMRDASTLKLH